MPKKECPPGKIVSPKGRCVKDRTKPVAKKECPPGKILSPKGRCVKDRTKPTAKKDVNTKIKNLERLAKEAQKRLDEAKAKAKEREQRSKIKKECPPGKVLSPKGRCVKDKTKVPPVKKECPPGKVLSPKGRCVKDRRKKSEETEKTMNPEVLEYIQKVLSMNRVVDKSGTILGYVSPSMSKKLKPKGGIKIVSPRVKDKTPMLSKNCKKIHEPKYLSSTRKSPPFSANDCCGEILYGNDGLKWESQKTKRGNCMWKRLKKISDIKKVSPKRVKDKTPKLTKLCKKQHEPKYLSATRKSPPYSANDCCGKVLYGNDGFKWESQKTKRGNCMWKRIKE